MGTGFLLDALFVLNELVSLALLYGVFFLVAIKETIVGGLLEFGMVSLFWYEFLDELII